jgi:predicted nucleic acid-binding protein
LNGSKSYALDTSFLVYHYYKGDERTNRFFEEGVTNLVTICETLYTICRKEGLQRALDFVKEVSKRVKIIPSERVTPIAGQFKCKYSISLADCWVLATAKIQNIPALFAFKEKELQEHLESLKHEVEVIFLEEVLK